MTTLVLEAQPASVPRARRWVSDHCQHASAQVATCDMLALLVSEVVTNAVVHGAGPVTVQLDETPELLCVAISDTSPNRPVLRRDVAALETGGRGMTLVAALAQAWGVREEPTGGGKRVWFAIKFP